MVQYCCVPLCKEYGGIHFPKDAKLRDLWRVAIRKGVPGKKYKLWEPSKYDVVCHLHFKTEDYSSTGERRRLKKGVVPSQFPERGLEQNEEKKECKRRRKERANKRASATVTSQYSEDCPNISDIQQEIEISTSNIKTEESLSCLEQNDKSVQCDLLKGSVVKFSVDKYRDNSKAIKYYTGFDDYEHFMMFFYVLGEAAYHLKFKCSLLHPKDQLFLTLMKIRQNKEDYELSLLFDITQSTVSNLVVTWINFIYFQLSEINFWPSKKNIVNYMPEDFKRKFPSTRVILDATENPIQKPTNVSVQSATFSTYKHKNNLKTMIGITPSGLVSYVSASYGGSTSDRQIIERSDLVKKKLFEKKDSIMADRGKMVQDLFATKDVRVNTPTMLSGKSQLEPETVVKDRRIASKRIHVERIIGLGKQYKILKSDLPASKCNLGSRIAFVCYMILNFRKCIVGRLA